MLEEQTVSMQRSDEDVGLSFTHHVVNESDSSLSEKV